MHAYRPELRPTSFSRLSDQPRIRVLPDQRTMQKSVLVLSHKYLKKNRTHSGGVGPFAFSLLLFLGHARLSTPVSGFTQILISSPRRKPGSRNGFKNRLDSGFRRNDVGKEVFQDYPVNKHKNSPRRNRSHGALLLSWLQKCFQPELCSPSLAMHTRSSLVAFLSKPGTMTEPWQVIIHGGELLKKFPPVSPPSKRFKQASPPSAERLGEK